VRSLDNLLRLHFHRLLAVIQRLVGNLADLDDLLLLLFELLLDVSELGAESAVLVKERVSLGGAILEVSDLL
jgi:hypothetical protein